MLKKIGFSLLTIQLSINLVLAQNQCKQYNFTMDDSLHSLNKRNSKIIKGEVIGNITSDDSIFFIKSFINKKYFEESTLSSKLENTKFYIQPHLSYPHKFRAVFKSEKNRLWRFEEYFIDSSTDSITINIPLEGCSKINGKTADEYFNRYIPFFTKGKYDCRSRDMLNLLVDKGSTYDSILYKYVQLYPNSYVALWNLIERFTQLGQSEIRERILKEFSIKIKNERIWEILNDDFKNALLKENEQFPDLTLKTLGLKEQKLHIPKAKVTLINYWFSRCRPCLDEIPELKKLYNLYHTRGFEIINISSDKTQDIPIWQERVKLYE